MTKGTTSLPAPDAPRITVQPTLTRRRLLRVGAAAAGPVLAGGLWLTGVSAPLAGAPSPEQDGRVVAYLLDLQRLEAAFYAEAVERDSLDGDLAEFARAAAAHEGVHVRHLGAAGMGAGDDRGAFEFGETTTSPTRFAVTAAALEDIAVYALNGQLANLTPPARARAAQVVSVDARHAAWVRAIEGRVAAPQATDAAEDQAAIGRRLSAAGLRLTP